MAGSDSDGGGSFTETTVLLGYAEKEPKGDEISHLGGDPTWLHPASPLDSRFAKCSSCNRLMPLLLQLNGAVPESAHDRMFYVFGCAEKTCRRKQGSVRALRCVKLNQSAINKEEEKWKREEERKKAVVAAAAVAAAAEVTKPKVDAGAMLFGSGPTGANPFSSGGAIGGVNPFSTGGTAAAAANPFSAKPPPAPTADLPKTFAAVLNITTSTPTPTPAPAPTAEPLYGPPEPWPSPLPFTYPHFYLDAEYETLDTAPLSAPQNVDIDALMSEDTDAPVSNSTADDGSLDATFQKFADTVAQNPEQVLRYERGGMPLLYTEGDEVWKTLVDKKTEQVGTARVPACGGCGKRGRVAEFQIMPNAITVLEGDSAGLDGLEWGTVIVVTCLCVPKVTDANGVGWVEEWVGVQWEAQK